MPETHKLKLKVTGPHTMHCAGCKSTVEFTLSNLPGVREVVADEQTQTIEVDLAPDQTDLAKVKDELAWIGYEVEEEAA